ncbi:MAG: TatD family hydrolase [Alphaproteobacteria bacterium]|nr:TatD family hydrolase [Alphaproteobacteria bacterium]
MIYTDAHCHLAPDAGNPEIACRIYNATRPTDWAAAIDVAERDDDRNFAAVGIHPWYIADVTTDFTGEISNVLATHPNLMVGEIGLDKYHPDMPRQIEIFTTQLEIAHKFRRPVHMHCVGAWDKILHIFRERGAKMPPAIVAHGFNGDAGQIQMLADKYNIYFSYHAPREGGADMARITATPKNRILVESDTANPIEEIEKLNAAIDPIAVAHQTDIEEMAEQIYQNLQRIISYVRPIA